MKKLLVLIVASVSFAVAQADEEFLGLYMGGNKIGHSSYTTHPDTLGTQILTRTDSKTVIDAGLLGAAMHMDMEGSTWINQGHPVKMLLKMSSAGRTQQLVIMFNAKTAEIDIDNEGHRTHESVPIPKDGSIVDDPLELVLGGKAAPGTKQTIYVLDPTTVSFIKTEVVVVGPKSTTIKGKTVQATLVQIVDPRLTTDVYVDSKGEFLKGESIGIEMIPESREEALANSSTAYKPSSDLAFTTSLRPNKNIADPAAVTGLTLRITGHDLSRLPSDEHQTVTKKGAAWIVDVHPPRLGADKSITIARAGKEKPEWLKPTTYIPSDSSRFKNLSASIVKGQTLVVPAAVAIKNYVTKTMQPNAGIGVLRDAGEVLTTKEGVCRDYAILTVTLMRAAGIPARLASGVVNWQGDFFYHAWAEIWDGAKWIGIDSTVPQKQMSAAHVKLADGNVEQAFAFTFLDNVKIEVLDIRRK